MTTPSKEIRIDRRFAFNFIMILSLCTVLFCVPFVCASLHSPNDTCIYTLDGSDPVSSNNTRTLWDLILSCGWTLFACTWTAVHPNIPGVNEGKVAIASRRIFIMVMALIAPELMITWATRQFFSARATAKDFNERFSAQPTKAYSNHRDISEKTATSHRDIPEGSGSPSAPQPAKSRSLLITGLFCQAGTDMIPLPS